MSERREEPDVPAPALRAEVRSVLMSHPGKCSDPLWYYLADRGPSARGILPALAGLLTDPVEYCRARAAEGLRYCGSRAKPFAPALAAALKDRSVEVRAQAAHTLAVLDPGQGAEAVAILVRLLSEDPDNWTACNALSEIGAEAAEPLLTQLREHAGDAQEPFIRTLARMGSGVVPALGLELADTAGRVGAARALGRIGGEAGAAFEHLAALLADPDGEVRRWSALALVQVDARRAGPAISAAGAIPLLIDELKACQAGSGTGVSTGGPSLEGLLKALAQVGEPAAAATPLIRQAMRSESQMIRAVAATALARMAPGHTAEAVDALVREMQNGQDAVDALAEVGPAARAAAPRLEAALLDEGERWWPGALFHALARIDGAAGLMARIDEGLRTEAGFDKAANLLIDIGFDLAMWSRMEETWADDAATMARLLAPPLKGLLGDRRVEGRENEIRVALEVFGVDA